MDARRRPQLTTPPPPVSTQKPRVWKPQSRIAPYIKGNAKLEDLVSRDKLVRPEHRHNKRAFMALVNDEDEIDSVAAAAGAATYVNSFNSKSEPHHQSAISQCPSTSTTKTSTSIQSSRAGGACGSAAGAAGGGRRHQQHHRRLIIDDLTRTVVEKNEQITALREQLDTLRNCASIQNMLLLLQQRQQQQQQQQQGKEDVVNDEGTSEAPNDGDHVTQANSGESHQLPPAPPLKMVLDQMLECLLDMLSTLRHQDEHDERMAEFVAAVRRERENVLRNVEALYQSNARKDEELRRTGAERAELCQRLGQLRDELERLRTSSTRRQQDYDLAAAETALLLRQLRHYEHKYEQAADELRHLGALSERIYESVAAEKRASDELVVKYRDEADERRAALEARHAEQLERMREQSDAYAERLRGEIGQRKEEAQRLENANADLEAQNAELRAELRDAQQTKLTIRDEVERLRAEKERLAQAAAEWEQDRREIWPRTSRENRHKLASFASQETHWHELKECFDKTVLRAGLLQDSDIR